MFGKQKGGHTILAPKEWKASPFLDKTPCSGSCEGFCEPKTMVWHCPKCDWHVCNNCAHLQMPPT